ncbi:tRNA pseudouridine(55) synthase TruB [Candidatus Peribacteria bacterium]|jgi:tRNA pseudouridine55 synthase|nr:tRNA pseudouridine(55) synthase TruB [Candidatus Peribacteria bacterium]MBT4021357.1 tRNA pseudouridine(55) synthase TruB [Candidatus Peribacteria bacterium]MBT4241253.1 tRNA pseudouridine(55) synthase TruB [Candidatus Peribacteria bacterium]MBT4474278.1 tRNA pseudouridine(55) synthase TruB [Candidatus Peribacteria bacterium]
MRHGILLIDKPEGPTSHDIVQMARKALGERAIGHIGTLDPAASGLLVLFVGKKALKTIELFKSLNKEYEARIAFGKISSTYDRDGHIEDFPQKKGWKIPADIELIKILNDKFTGLIRQVPPSHSAVHVLGKRAYEIMRKNPDAILDLNEREIRISKMQLVSYEYPHCMLKIGCSSGTYIRSIANDLGEVLKCGGYLEGLRRTRVGNWNIKDATDENIVWPNVIPLKEVLSGFPKIELNDEQFEDIKHGRLIDGKITEYPCIGWHGGLPVGILKMKEGKVHGRKVF